jgi:hypothetical protein
LSAKSQQKSKQKYTKGEIQLFFSKFTDKSLRFSLKKMGKPDEFKITFTNNKRVYYAGDMVTGNVVAKSRKKLKFRSIRMEFLGEAKVTRASNKDWVTVQSYFDEKVEIYGKGLQDIFYERDLGYYVSSILHF